MELIIDSEFDPQNNNWMIEITGEIDLFNSADMKNKLLSLLDDKPANLIIDCKKLDYIDSTALGALIAVLKNTKSYGCDVILKNIKPKIEKLFRITNLDRVFKIEGDKDEQ